MNKERGKYKEAEAPYTKGHNDGYYDALAAYTSLFQSDKPGSMLDYWIGYKDGFADGIEEVERRNEL